ncbi:MAG: hypothetical protein ABL963_09185 [Longimicrobiales bacterium]
MSFGPALLQAVPRDGLSVAADISIVIVAVAVVVLAIVLTLVLVRVSKVLVEIRNGVRTNLGPVAERSRGIAENVEFITRSIRTDVEKLNGSVTAVTDKLKLASERMEERIEDFNALMEVVQEEAEDVFIDTAATVRGVRAGMGSIAGGRRGAAPNADPENLFDELDEAARSDAPSDEDAVVPDAAQPASSPESERSRALAAENG